MRKFQTRLTAMSLAALLLVGDTSSVMAKAPVTGDVIHTQTEQETTQEEARTSISAEATEEATITPTPVPIEEPKMEEVETEKPQETIAPTAEVTVQETATPTVEPTTEATAPAAVAEEHAERPEEQQTEEPTATPTAEPVLYTGESVEAFDAGPKDYSDPSTEEKAHAYNPFSKLESEEETEAYRGSVEYKEKTVIFKKEVAAVKSSKEITENAAVKGIQDELNELGIESTEVILGQTAATRTYGVNGKAEVVLRGTLKEDNVWDVVDALSEVDGVLDAEPEYIYRATYEGLPDATTDKDIDKQWYLNNLNATGTWKGYVDNGAVPGEGTVVAVIDTGVDYEHDDLKNSMWINTAELNGTPGVDDDGNGYVDDIYGMNAIVDHWDYSKQGDPMDDHGHGTHVAGIIGMSAGNNTGGVGLAYGSKVMAIKAAQADGSFASSDIAEAIRYATMMGADVINMSFGGYGRSFLVEEALQDAFSTTVLVAAAGNDGIPTADAPPEFLLKADTYPAAYSYVIGVMASNSSNQLASFSNWDYYNNKNAEYEVIAPGVQIYSTLPGNQYASWSGTSMAAPMVAATAALVRAKYPDKDTYSSRFIMGQLSSASQDTVTYVDKEKEEHIYTALNLSDSLNNIPKPNVTVKNTYLFDYKNIEEANDEDGIVDAGELIDLGLVLRNQWGLATKVTVKVDAISDGGVANPYVEFINDTITLDNIGTFTERNNGFVYENDAIEGVDNPIRFRVKENAPNDGRVKLNITVTCKNGWDKTDTTTYEYEDAISFVVQRGKVLKGVIKEDMTLTKDNYWIIENSLMIEKNATVTVEPGTQIQFWSSDPEDPYAEKAMAYIQVNGKFLVNGTEEEPVEIFPSKWFANYGVILNNSIGKIELNYANVVNLANSNIDTVKGSNFVQDYNDVVYRELWSNEVRTYTSYSMGSIGKCENTIFTAIRSSYNAKYLFIKANQCQFVESGIEFSSSSSLVDCAFVGNRKETDYGNQSITSISNPGSVYVSKEPELVGTVEFDGKEYTIYQYLSDIGCIGSDDSQLYNMRYELSKRILENKGMKFAEWPELYSYSFEEQQKFLNQIYEMRTDKNSSVQLYVNNENGIVGDYKYVSINRYSGDNYISNYLNNSRYYEMYQYCFFLTESMDEQNTVPEPITAKEIMNLLTKEEIGFYNNAFLSRILDPDVSKWLKVQTSSSYPTTYSAQYNYWGTTNEKLIQKQVLDHDTYIHLADIITDNYLETPAESTFPFVYKIYLTDDKGNVLDKVGSETVNVHVVFNRDMDKTKQPFITYGPAAPYTDYMIEGDYVSSREWVGTMKTNAMLNSGMMYFRTKDAVAADDGWLKTGADYGRFAFEISSTDAKAMTLQAEGGEDKVTLSWIQDDYDTLAGYNVYRAEGENGYFTKINSKLIPSTIREYTDRDVEAGKTYSYYFTVVETSLTESKPSNTVQATPIDNIKPSVTHKHVTSINFGDAISLNVTATDNIGVEYVRAYYRTPGTTSYRMINLTKKDSNYHGVIPASEITKQGIEYYIEVSDGNSIVREGSSVSPIKVTVNSKVVLYSVTPSKVDVTGNVEAKLAGINFEEGMTVKVGSTVVAHTLVNEKELKLTIPSGAIGRQDITVTTAAGEKAVLTNAVTYTDDSCEVQISGTTLAAENRIKLPVTVTSSGNVFGLDLELGFSKDNYYSVYFEKAEEASHAYAESYYYGNGTYKISMAASSKIPTDKPVGYIVIEAYNVNEEINDTIKMKAAKINGVDVKSVVDANIVIKPNKTVEGRVSYYASSDVMVDGVTLITTEGVSAVTDQYGYAKLSGITKGSTAVTAVKENAENGAISAQDASLVLQSIVGAEKLSELQETAADVDGDGTISAMDAVYILQKSVGIIEETYPGSNALWTFSPQMQQVDIYSSTACIEMKAILLGDVTGNWTASGEE